MPLWIKWVYVEKQVESFSLCLRARALHTTHQDLQSILYHHTLPTEGKFQHCVLKFFQWGWASATCYVVQTLNEDVSVIISGVITMCERNFSSEKFLLS